ncbi:MAG: hypothetical protein ACF8R9_04605 [Phycisphaerales bacterium JB054]
MAGVSWIWVVVAVPLLVAGVVCVARFMLGDRSRGRLRCPKCWYDMDGGGEKCPECGRVVRSGRDLRRTRRPKRWAVVGVGLLLLGGASLATRRVMLHGAVSLVPDWVLVAGMERWPADSTLYLELKRRHWEGELSVGSQRSLIRKAVTVLGESQESMVLERAAFALQTAESLGQFETERHSKPWNTWVTVTEEVDSREVILKLCDIAMRSPSTSAAGQAQAALTAFGERSAVAFPLVADLNLRYSPNHPLALGPAVAMLGEARRPYGHLRDIFGWRAGVPELPPDLVEWISQLAARSESPERYRETLREMLTKGEQESRLLAMWIVRSSLWPDDELRTLALSRYDAEHFTAAAVVDFAVLGPLDEPAQAVVREALATRDYEQWALATERLGDRGKEAAVFADDLREMVGTNKALMSAVPYFRITGDGETAAKALMRFLYEEERAGDASVLQKLGQIGWFDEAVLAVLRDRLDADSADTRLAAATTLLRLGGPAGFDRAALTRAAAEAANASFGGLNVKSFGDSVQYGEADIPTVMEFLGDCSMPGASLVVWEVGMAGSAAEGALPSLRELTTSTVPNVASNAALAIRRIEWCLKHGDPPPAPRDDR